MTFSTGYADAQSMSAPVTAVVTPADPAWRPTSKQQQAIQRQSSDYFSAKDTGDYKKAYSYAAMPLTFDQWQISAQKFNAMAGEVRSRKIKKITWYKDLPQQPPGIFAAVDFVSQFANADIHCGYLVWQPASDGRFRLIREEQNYIDRETHNRLSADKLAEARKRLGC